jgi:hypothetical protein
VVHTQPVLSQPQVIFFLTTADPHLRLPCPCTQIFLGDLNYRLSDVTPAEALRLIADAARATPDTFPPTASETAQVQVQGMTWLQRRYARTMSANGPPSPAPPDAWTALLDEGRDELRAGMATGSVLHHFVEAPIGFPPSYRRSVRPTY